MVRIGLRHIVSILIAVLCCAVDPDARASASTVTVGAHQVPEPVFRAIQRAAQATGIAIDFLVSQAAQESGFRADARAGTSSATGLYQFIESTWLQMLRDYGARHGYGHIAQQIEGQPGGAAYVSDPSLRRQILDLRYDPLLSSLLAAEYALMNQAQIERSTGRSIRHTDLYLGHFLGTEGAVRFMINLHANPEASAADLFPSAAGANQGVFYDRREGFALSLRQVYERFSARFEGRGNEIRVAQPSNVRVQNGVTIIAGPPRNMVEMIRVASASVQVLRPQNGGIGGGFFAIPTATSTTVPSLAAPALRPAAMTVRRAPTAPIATPGPDVVVAAAGQIGGGRIYTIRPRNAP